MTCAHGEIALQQKLRDMDAERVVAEEDVADASDEDGGGVGHDAGDCVSSGSISSVE